jgi:hypothetical protein
LTPLNGQAEGGYTGAMKNLDDILPRLRLQPDLRGRYPSIALGVKVDLANRRALKNISVTVYCPR